MRSGFLGGCDAAAYDCGIMEAIPEPGGDEGEDGATTLFDAVLLPHRSMSPPGFAALMAVVSLIGFAAGIAFMMVGAWPVFGFLGLDIALIYFAFRTSYRRARTYETVRLTEEKLVVERISPSGDVQNWQFQPYWLRVEIDDPPLPDSPLTLSSHGTSLVIGTFLTPEERVELADALRTALQQLRQPPLGAAE